MPLSDDDLLKLADQHGISAPNDKPQGGISDSDLVALANKHGVDLPTKEPVSGYAGSKADDLSWYQKAEKKAEDIGLVKPGRELFSPAALENKKEALIAMGYMAAQAAPGLLKGAALGAGMGVGAGLLRRIGDFGGH